MRRFLFCLVLLVLTLLISRSLDAQAAHQHWLFGPSDYGWSDGDARASIHVNLDLEDEELFRPRHQTRSKRSRRTRNYPRARDGEVLFRIEDRGYDRVYLEASFFEWEEEPMLHDEARDVWEIRVALERGAHRYVFVIEDERGRRRRTDPSHSQRSKRSHGRWVSEIEVDGHGRVRAPERDRYDDYDFEILQSFTIGYQRVDGLILGARPSFESNQPYAPSVRGWLGYGFGGGRWSGQLTLLQPLTYDDDVRLILSGYDKTDFTQQTGVGSMENTLTSWVFREDHRDYYEREGVSFGVGAELGRDSRATVLFRSDTYESLRNDASASWGWGRDRFLPNPAVDEGMLRSLVASVRLGSELRHLAIDYEIADDDLATTSSEFTQITAQYRTRIRLGRMQYFDLRVKGGTNLRGRLPVQKRYHVGGLGTVRGYNYQSLLTADRDRAADAESPFGGERMVLFNAEYAFGVVDDVQLVLLFDSGMAWEDQDAEFRFDELQSSVGLGIQSDDGGFRLDFVKTLEDSGSDILAQARLNRPF